MSNFVGKWTVTVHEGDRIKNSLLDKSDPYCIVKIDDKQFRTRTHDNGGTRPQSLARLFRRRGLARRLKSLRDASQAPSPSGAIVSPLK
jgi:hypothetical protein